MSAWFGTSKLTCIGEGQINHHYPFAEQFGIKLFSFVQHLTNCVDLAMSAGYRSVRNGFVYTVCQNTAIFSQNDAEMVKIKPVLLQIVYAGGLLPAPSE